MAAYENLLRKIILRAPHAALLSFAAFAWKIDEVGDKPPYTSVPNPFWNTGVCMLQVQVLFPSLPAAGRQLQGGMPSQMCVVLPEISCTCDGSTVWTGAADATCMADTGRFLLQTPKTEATAAVATAEMAGGYIYNTRSTTICTLSNHACSGIPQ